MCAIIFFCLFQGYPMLDQYQFRHHVVRPTLLYLEPEIPYSLAAENLIVGTALHESKLTNIKQLGGGPALGLLQIEPDTAADNWQNYLLFRKTLHNKVKRLEGSSEVLHLALTGNLPYQVAMARVKYFRDPEPLPRSSDAEGMSLYWKRVYNTKKGKGTVEQFLESYQVVE